ncbi:ferredoxin [Micromonospora sp. KLBMP9576]|uniref:ferredoxin n=1 Tax=Micromonospora sp. KLBMP9576 TaxID=3424769 RepID=UPI003D91A822
MSRVTVTVDAQRCVGSATCCVVAPGSFALDEHDRSAPTTPVTAQVAAVEEAARLCPTGAILVAPVDAP